jgi:hypothetical protein
MRSESFARPKTLAAAEWYRRESRGAWKSAANPLFSIEKKKNSAQITRVRTANGNPNANAKSAF